MAVCHQQDFASHEVRVLSIRGRVWMIIAVPRHTDQQYLRSTEEMLAFFSDIPEPLENTVRIGQTLAI